MLRRNQGWKIGVVSSGTPFWEWLIPRLGVHVWTFRQGIDVDLKSKLKSEPVDVVLFDKSAPSTSCPVWKAAGVKCVMWEAWARLNKQAVEDFGWNVDNTKYNHQAVGGLTNLHCIMRSAWRNETLD